MTAAFEGVSVVLLDIEGTTTPISFVYDTLFPYARRHLRAFVSERHDDPDVAHALGLLRDERGASQSPELGSLVAYAEELMDRDSKSSGLKALQGLIWSEGYASGELRGVVFDDVPTALSRWRTMRLRTAIYSSGSVLAQKLIFRTTQFGDLTPEIEAFFDTAIGPKRESPSYGAIADRLGCRPQALLFISDVMPEITASAQAGCQTTLIVRPGNPAQSGIGATAVIGSLSDVSVQR